MIDADTTTVPEDVEGANLSGLKTKSSPAFRNVARELSDEDLTNPAVVKLLLDDKDRLESENADLKEYQSKYHEADKERAVLEKDLNATKKMKISKEIIEVSSLTAGAVMIGIAPALWEHQPWGWTVLICGVVLVLCGIGARGVKI